MQIKAEFANGSCRLILTPEDAWEQHLLGAIAKGGEALDGLVEYEPEWHYSYGKCKAVKILLGAANAPAHLPPASGGKVPPDVGP